jgi:hypothetical protein
MELAAAGLVCGCGGALATAVLVASLLRLAISLTNKIVGPAQVKSQSSGGIAEWDWDDWDDEYSTPARSRRRKGTIPEPGILKCVGIVLATAFVFGLGFIVVAFVLEDLGGLGMWRDEAQLAAAILNLPVADLALSVLLVVMLPTSLSRAMMVAFVYNLILIAIIVSIGAVVFVVSTVLG